MRRSLIAVSTTDIVPIKTLAEIRRRHNEIARLCDRFLAHYVANDSLLEASWLSLSFLPVELRALIVAVLHRLVVRAEDVDVCMGLNRCQDLLGLEPLSIDNRVYRKYACIDLISSLDF